MTVGISAYLANGMLGCLRGTSFTISAAYARLHTGDPGAAGLSNTSAEATRKAVTYAAPSAGSLSITGTVPSWPTWTAGSETLSHVSVWDAVSGGNFLYSYALSAPQAVVNGDTPTLNAHTVPLTPIAA